ncbi:CbtA family protein [Entomobacter blattae]|uniref:Putative cobalt transporter subunit CbtA n=1 Tax=Entomobacter blattae TaxID=2762277 RepID=A0A7H1NPK7_9PROT|nr:CbtA family protein [Entomobacter blattae]QNT77717.1 putative cobalt transporter subunit CbtA [Entomobacter blattae]
MGALLARGMVSGFLAACLAVLVAVWFGEPQITKAIQFEELHAHGGPSHSHHHEGYGEEKMHTQPSPSEVSEEEPVSRGVQKTLGLFVAVAVYGVAFGGVFSIGFALLYGRFFGNALSVRMVSLLLGMAGFLVFVLVPGLKYPANPPAVGLAATIGIRTASYFEMLLFSFCSAIFGGIFFLKLRQVLSSWNAAIAGGILYLALVGVLQRVLPPMVEVPPDFSALVLWSFRIASFAMQAVLWVGMGLIFGAMAEKYMATHYHALPKQT